MVTTKEQSMEAGDKFRAADVDLVCLGILVKNMPKHLAGYYLLNSYKPSISIYIFKKRHSVILAECLLSCYVLSITDD